MVAAEWKKKKTKHGCLENLHLLSLRLGKIPDTQNLSCPKKGELKPGRGCETAQVGVGAAIGLVMFNCVKGALAGCS